MRIQLEGEKYFFKIFVKSMTDLDNSSSFKFLRKNSSKQRKSRLHCKILSFIKKIVNPSYFAWVQVNSAAERCQALLGAASKNIIFMVIFVTTSFFVNNMPTLLST